MALACLSEQDYFERFAAELAEAGPSALHDGLIGKGAHVDGPWGSKPLIYADYVASGRALMQIEQAILRHVLPYYANSHTQASHCGAATTKLREQARRFIGRCCGASDSDHAVVFTGSGATSGINRLVHLLGIRQAMAEVRPVRILIGPYEHHSNILPWRESGAEIIEIKEASSGGPDLAEIDAALSAAPEGALLIGAFSAASNVTGIITDVAAVTRTLKRHGAFAVWDYAGGGPYLPIAMRPAPDAPIDAVVISPHKFTGGPGASGIMIVRRSACVDDRPSLPGGGTVSFVSPWGHDYSSRIEAREEAGTPNVVGDIRAGLAFAVKAAIGADLQHKRGEDLVRRAFDAWSDCPQLQLLGQSDVHRLPIFSFRVRDGDGGFVHHQLITRLLSDRYGIQARGGCACAGSYVHRLLGLNHSASDALRDRILNGHELDKPGFVRLNFSVLMDDDEVDYILASVRALSEEATDLAHRYRGDPATAIFRPVPNRMIETPQPAVAMAETAHRRTPNDAGA